MIHYDLSSLWPPQVKPMLYLSAIYLACIVDSFHYEIFYIFGGRLPIIILSMIFYSQIVSIVLLDSFVVSI